jgi:hypothetical protein
MTNKRTNNSNDDNSNNADNSDNDGNSSKHQLQKTPEAHYGDDD